MQMALYKKEKILYISIIPFSSLFLTLYKYGIESISMRYRIVIDTVSNRYRCGIECYPYVIDTVSNCYCSVIKPLSNRYQYGNDTETLLI
jgi:hypothetical protein